MVADPAVARAREDLRRLLAGQLVAGDVEAPPLRERPGDVALLAREFARKYSERFGLGYVVQLAPEFIHALEQESWPGNVRQLENTIARSVALATDRILGPAILGRFAEGDGDGEAAGPASGDGAAAAPRAGRAVRGPSFREQVEAFERNLLGNALAAAAGNQSEAARRLGMTRGSLYDKMKKYGVSAGPGAAAKP